MKLIHSHAPKFRRCANVLDNFDSVFCEIFFVNSLLVLFFCLTKRKVPKEKSSQKKAAGARGLTHARFFGGPAQNGVFEFIVISGYDYYCSYLLSPLR